MASIGMLIVKDGQVTGTLRTLHLSIALRMEPREKRGEDSPDMDVQGKLSSNDWAYIGAAWLRTFDKGEHRGKRFYSLALDDPAWPHPLNVSAFPVDGSAEQYEIIWRRERQDRQAA